MSINSQHDSMILAGNIPGVALVLERKMIADPTLVGYIEQTCRELLAIAELEFQQQGRVHASMKAILFDVRDQYNEALNDNEIEAPDDEGAEGDIRLFARFQTVLNSNTKKEPVGRPFSKRKEHRIKPADTISGGCTLFNSRRDR